MKKQAHSIHVFLLCVSAVVFFGFGLKLIGLLLLAVGVISLLVYQKQFKRDVLLLYTSIIILTLTPVSTSITYTHIALMSIGLFLALFIPYTFSPYMYKENIIRFFFAHKRNWTRLEVLYLISVITVTYLLLPVFLFQTGSYLNWTVELNPDSLFRLFLGVNLMGAWDELFFVFTLLTLLKRFLPIAQANLAQAVLFSSFLYELGFHGWSILVVFIFTLLQGYVFLKTKSIAYLITIHLCVDMILYLFLIHSHFPQVLGIFLT